MRRLDDVGSEQGDGATRLLARRRGRGSGERREAGTTSSSINHLDARRAGETVTAPAPLTATLPVPSSLRPEAVFLVTLAALLMLKFKRSVPLTLALTALAGWALGQLLP